ncbi:MAG: small protein [Caulobacterales bacterium 32-69-10]|nr:MAG: small protein [Caulobacterales bacterium 32-69-10]
MTHSISNEAFAALGGPDLVYVREIKAKEVLGAGDEAFDRFELHPDQTLYALHRADGARLAVLADRESAFAAAVAHELAPVSVH